jgi:hypothetical protein
MIAYEHKYICTFVHTSIIHETSGFKSLYIQIEKDLRRKARLEEYKQQKEVESVRKARAARSGRTSGRQVPRSDDRGSSIVQKENKPLNKKPERGSAFQAGSKKSMFNMAYSPPSRVFTEHEQWSTSASYFEGISFQWKENLPIVAHDAVVDGSCSSDAYNTPCTTLVWCRFLSNVQGPTTCNPLPRTVIP